MTTKLSNKARVANRNVERIRAGAEADHLPNTNARTLAAMSLPTVSGVRETADFIIPLGARVRRWRLVAYRAWLSASTVTQLTKN